MTVVDNNDNTIGDYSNGNKFFCEDTEDKIFLLSKGEAKDADYGFTYVKDESSNDSRKKSASDYASTVIIANGYSPTNSAWWWLRTPSYVAAKDDKSNLAQVVKTSGTYDSYVVDLTTGGVVPAMWINI
jgi:hypothetical protein